MIPETVRIESKMENSNLQSALRRYKKAIENLEKSASSLSLDVIIAVLTARDEIYSRLLDKTQDFTAYLVEINELDKKLRQYLDLFSDFDDIADLRLLVNAPAEAWWWPNENSKKKSEGHVSGMWEPLTLPWLTVNLALIADISSRFLATTPDTISTFAIVFQSMLAALATGGSLTKAGQDLIDGIYKSFRIPERFWGRAKLISALALSIFLILLRTQLSSIAYFYNLRGYNNFRHGRLDEAKQDYLQAIRLNPNFVEANYSLGQVYERLQDSDNAIAKYKISAELGSARAYSAIGRIYNRKKEYSMAVYFLIRGESLLDKPSLNISSVDKDNDTKYAIWRDLGWARLEQGRYDEAQFYLNKAIELVPERVTAHCLMAQVLDKQKQKQKALRFWEKCQKYFSKLPVDGKSVELDDWIGMAKQALDAQKNKR